MFIKDMFFLHEHARKINIWSGFIVLSPYLGPLLAAFIVNTQIWQWAFGIYAIETGLCLFAIILFVDETYYDRKTSQPELITTGPRWQRMLGIQQMRTGYIKNSVKDVIMRPAIMICKPVVFIASVYYMLTFAWVVGINTTLSILLGPIYGFESKQLGKYSYPNPRSKKKKKKKTELTNKSYNRLLLLYSYRRDDSRRDRRTLASRHNRQIIRPTPRRSP